MTSEFPAEDEPDGDSWAPHHFWWGGGLAAFAFGMVWPYYPTLGAALTVLGTLVVADDVLSHAFGVWTPLDAAWRHLAPLLRR